MRLLAGLCLSAFIATAVPPSLSAQTPPPLIARARLFGNPSKVQVRLSPDGKWISWIAPRDGVLNIWVAPSGDTAKSRPLTAEKARPIRSYFWAPDSSQILFVNDKGGDENFLLYSVDPVNVRQRTLTPFERTRVEIVAISDHVPGRILVGLNNRDPRWHDVYSLDLKTGHLTFLLRNDGYAGFLADDNLALRIASKERDDGGTDYYHVSGTRIDPLPFVSVGLDDGMTTGPAGFTTDGKTLYWTDSRNRDTAALFAQDVTTGKMTLIASDARADVGGIMADPKTGRVQAYSIDYLKDQWTALDPAIGADLDWLRGQLKGEPIVTSRTRADDRWTVAVDPVVAPSASYLFDRKARKLTRLFVSRPELEGAPLVAMHPEEIRSRDGLTLVSYLSLPRDADADGDGKADHPVPMVLLVHGGPWARDDYGYDGEHQWLANRSYAVLSVNYRGSTGFGKRFTNAGNLQWGTRMQDDLLDAVDWAVRQGVTTRDKVAIMGGSYGGYATLAGLSFTPTAFACGVDIVGPSNLQTLLKTIPPYWEAGRQQFYKRMGDPTTDAGRKLLKERSPLNSADRIVRPLLIGQGANDPRVNKAESDQIVAAMAARNIPVTYVLFPDEGHGFARPENNIAFDAVTENFLQTCLGGRSEPIGDALKASTAQVPHGAEFAAGLSQALSR